MQDADATPTANVNTANLASRVREMILSGALAPGERVTEDGLSKRLGVSRTPIRNILASLAGQGLLTPVGRRGLAVTMFDDQQSWEALELRSVMEGQAARLLARKGISAALAEELADTLRQGDRLFEKRYFDHEDEDAYGQMNDRFHRLITESCGSPMLIGFVERLNTVPFVAPSVIAFEQIGLSRAFELLFRAHGQHHAIVEAIKDGNGERAEALFREHAYPQRESMFVRRAKLSAGSAEGDEPPKRRRGRPRKVAK